MSTNKTIRNKIVVLTPIRNEGWFLDIFLAATSLWADVIIISDQHSTDNSREIAKKYKKVIFIESPSLKYFNEYKMRNVLFNEANKIKEKKILFAVDADELFTPNIFHSKEWKKIISSRPGTVIQFKWANMCPNLEKYWSPNMYYAKTYADDGSPYIAGKIHTLNIPFPKHARVINSKTIKLIHFQYVDWKKMESKHRWYQCWERINDPTKSPVTIYRQYHHMNQIKDWEYKKVPRDWHSIYKNMGVNYASYKIDNHYWRDIEILDYISSFGSEYFSKEAIWDVDWKVIASNNGYKNIEMFSDPRNLIQKTIHLYLNKTQKYYPNKLLILSDMIIRKIFYF